MKVEKFERAHMLSELKSEKEPWDIIVIGGGASGLGTALESATRGFRTLVVEKYDWAKGTSSRSTKLAHGGVRYLKQGDVSLVIEALHERGLMMQNAPHLVHNQAFVIPNYDWWGGPFYTVGLKVYDLLAGKLGIGPSTSLNKEETVEYLPTITQEGLNGGVMYYDGQFDDARLAVNIAQTVADSGGVLINYMEVVDLLKTDGMVTGIRLKDRETKEEIEVNGKVVINATGVFADKVMRMDEPEAKKRIKPSQGVHVVLDKSFLPGSHAIMVPKTDDGRVLFAVPWYDKVILGTTDTPLDKISAEPRALEEEVEFILKHAAQYLTKNPSRSDVLSVYAGLRPLVKDAETKNTSNVSRSHQIRVSVAGLVTLMGGKWTTYRRMGEDAVNKAALIAGLPDRPSITKQITISGYKQNVDRTDPLYFYGSHHAEIQYLIEKDSSLGEALHEKIPLIGAQVIWAVDREMARTVEDVLSRRTRWLLLDARASKEVAPKVAQLMASRLGKDEAWIAEQIETYTKLADGYLLT